MTEKKTLEQFIKDQIADGGKCVPSYDLLVEETPEDKRDGLLPYPEFQERWVAIRHKLDKAAIEAAKKKAEPEAKKPEPKLEPKPEKQPLKKDS